MKKIGPPGFHLRRRVPQRVSFPHQLLRNTYSPSAYSPRKYSPPQFVEEPACRAPPARTFTSFCGGLYVACPLSTYSPRKYSPPQFVEEPACRAPPARTSTSIYGGTKCGRAPQDVLPARTWLYATD